MVYLDNTLMTKDSSFPCQIVPLYHPNNTKYSERLKLEIKNLTNRNNVLSLITYNRSLMSPSFICLCQYAGHTLQILPSSLDFHKRVCIVIIIITIGVCGARCTPLYKHKSTEVVFLSITLSTVALIVILYGKLKSLRA